MNPPDARRTVIDAAILELEKRVALLKRTPVGEGGRLMSRGVLTSATRVAILMGVDLDTAGPTIDLAAQDSPLLQEIGVLTGEMAPPVMTGNRGFRRFWPRNRKRPPCIRFGCPGTAATPQMPPMTALCPKHLEERESAQDDAS